MKYNSSVGPRIEIRGEALDDVVRLDIIDNGGGITRLEAARVFEKFARNAAGD